LLDLERIKREERDLTKKVESYNKGEIQKVGQLIGEFRTEGVPERSKSEMRAPRVESLESEEETREFDM